MIITIGRQFCSGGSEIGRKLSERLGIPYYDKNLYEHAAENSGFSPRYVREIEETPTGSFLYSLAMFPYVDFGADNMIPSGILISADQTEYILEKAKEGPCIFVGRCADSILSSAACGGRNSSWRNRSGHWKGRLADIVRLYPGRTPGSGSWNSRRQVFRKQSRGGRFTEAGEGEGNDRS